MGARSPGPSVVFHRHKVTNLQSLVTLCPWEMYWLLGQSASVFGQEKWYLLDRMENLTMGT